MDFCTFGQFGTTKYKYFLWVCWLLAKNPYKFVSSFGILKTHIAILNTASRCCIWLEFNRLKKLEVDKIRIWFMMLLNEFSVWPVLGSWLEMRHCKLNYVNWVELHLFISTINHFYSFFSHWIRNLFWERVLLQNDLE